MLLSCALIYYSVFIARSVFIVDGHLHATLFDDAMISMRYARNFAEGFGLTWNIGGARVQGYTNPLWTFLMVAVHLSGIPPRLTSLAMMLIGAAILLGLVDTTYRLARVVLDDRHAIIAATLTAFSYPLVYWTLRGMEVGFIALLVTLAALHAVLFARGGRVRHVAIVSVALTLALWTRIDAIVPVLVIAAYLMGFAPKRRSAAVPVAVSIAVGVAAPLVFGSWYFGSALPNTYYLKLDGAGAIARMERGAASLAALTARSLASAFVVAAAALVVVRRRNATLQEVHDAALLTALVMAQCAYSVYVGGDAWEWMGYANRYIAVALPALSILIAWGSTAIIGSDRSAHVMAILLILAAVAQALVTLWLLGINRAVDSDAAGWFAANRAATTAIVLALAAILAGAAALASRRKTIAGLVVAVWLLSYGAATLRWVVANGFFVREDMRAARLGLLMRDTLARDAAFAVSWAGSAPYFSERTAVDLLGKTDPVVARMPPRIAEFVPGHDKWNLEYSIGKLRPDVACNLPRRPGELEYLSARRYEPVGGTCFARADAKADLSRLRDGIAALFPVSGF